MQSLSCAQYTLSPTWAQTPLVQLLSGAQSALLTQGKPGSMWHLLSEPQTWPKGQTTPPQVQTPLVTLVQVGARPSQSRLLLQMQLWSELQLLPKNG
jgi:hypothetical protein